MGCRANPRRALLHHSWPYGPTAAQNFLHSRLNQVKAPAITSLAATLSSHFRGIRRCSIPNTFLIYTFLKQLSTTKMVPVAGF